MTFGVRDGFLSSDVLSANEKNSYKMEEEGRRIRESNVTTKKGGESISYYKGSVATPVHTIA